MIYQLKSKDYKIPFTCTSLQGIIDKIISLELKEDEDNYYPEKYSVHIVGLGHNKYSIFDFIVMTAMEDYTRERSEYYAKELLKSIDNIMQIIRSIRTFNNKTEGGDNDGESNFS